VWQCAQGVVGSLVITLRVTTVIQVVTDAASWHVEIGQQKRGNCPSQVKIRVTTKNSSWQSPH